MASVAWVGLRSFAGTFVVVVALGAVLAGLSCYFLSEHAWPYGVLSFVVVLFESAAAGFALGGKRSILMALMHGLGSLQLGSSLVRLVFERMLRIVEGKEVGGGNTRIAHEIGRLPFSQANQLLTGAVQSVLGDKEEEGWLRRRIRARLLGVVQKYTLTRFRREDAEHGNIDLLKVKQELEQSVDNAVMQKLRRDLQLWTAVALVGLPLLVAGQTYLLRLLLQIYT